MFRITILLFRFLFIACMILFLWQTVKFFLGKERETESDRYILVQRILLIVFDVAGFLILQIGGYSENIPAMAIGLVLAVFIAAFSIITDKMYKKRATVIINSVLFLITVGMITLQRLDSSLALRQILWLMAGLVIITIMPICIRALPKLYKFKYLYIAIALALTAFTFVAGEEVYGSKNWITVGGFGFQPSEITKLLVILYLASVFRKDGSIKNIFIGGIPTAAIVLLLVMEKDLGGALIFFMTYMLMMYVATSNELLFIGGMGVASAAAAAAYKFFSHVRVRVMAWMDPWTDIDTGGYQIAQSLFAIGAGGFLGTGLTLGSPQSIPFVEKDIIFSAICEEFGIIFGIGVILLFLVIFAYSLSFALKLEDRFMAMLSVGICSNMAFQTFLIIGGNIKLLPLTGVTLPFVSYGGSSFLISMVMLSLLSFICSIKTKGCEDDA